MTEGTTMPAEREAIVRIAKGLTDGQKRGLFGVRQTYNGEHMVNSGSNQNTRDALEAMGLITHSTIFGFQMVLTRKGIAVRDHLKESTHE